MARPSNRHNQGASKQEVTTAAMAWAEFLYDEFMLKKHKQLLSVEQDKKIEPKQQGGEGNT